MPRRDRLLDLPTERPLAGGATSCPSCGASAWRADQRYCLDCGHRRGDPRLPFMDAVVFMDAIKRQPQPPPPPATAATSAPRISANASLIAGVATLVLAIGVGVLIGRSGDSGSHQRRRTAPQVIKVGGGGEEAATAVDRSARRRAAAAARRQGEEGGKGRRRRRRQQRHREGGRRSPEAGRRREAAAADDASRRQVRKGRRRLQKSGEFNGELLRRMRLPRPPDRSAPPRSAAAAPASPAGDRRPTDALSAAYGAGVRRRPRAPPRPARRPRRRAAVGPRRPRLRDGDPQPASRSRCWSSARSPCRTPTPN